MILFLYGENNYDSLNKLNDLKSKFIEKHGDLNLEIISGEKIKKVSDIVNCIETLPFLGTKRMVIIKNLLSKKNVIQDKIADYLDKIPHHVILIFFESTDTIDKRKKLYKKLKKPKVSQEFKKPSGYILNKWIENKFKTQNVGITNEAINSLALAAGQDLWLLENEIKKLVLYKKRTATAITLQDVKLFVKSAIHADIFRLVDFLGQKQSQKALLELENLKESGENEIYLLTMIVYQFRNLIQARDIINQGGNNYDLQKRAKMHPFVAKKTIAQAQNFQMPELKKIYHSLLKIDFGIKTGKIEPHIALDQFVVKITS